MGDPAATEFLNKYAPRQIPGIIPTDAKQLLALTSINAFDHVIQSETHLGSAFVPTGTSISPEGFMQLSGSSALAIYKVTDPEILVLGLYSELPSLCKAIQHFKTILPGTSKITFAIFDTRASDLYDQGIPLAERLPVIPFSVRRSTRTLASLAPAETYTTWIIASDEANQPRATARQADFRPLRMMEAGVDPTVLTFASPAVPANQFMLQCNVTWKPNALDTLAAYLPASPPELPGWLGRTTKQLFPRIPETDIERIWDLMSKAQDFILAPVLWTRGDTLTRGPDADIYEVWLDKTLRDSTQPFAFDALMKAAAGSSHPTSLFTRRFAIQPTGPNKWRMLLSANELANIRGSIRMLKGELGFRFKEEATGAWLDADDDPVKQYKPEDTAFISGIPPFWGGQEIASALHVQGNLQMSLVPFSVGDIRTTTWVVEAQGISRLHGAVLRSQHEILQVMSPASYSRTKRAITAGIASRNTGTS